MNIRFWVTCSKKAVDPGWGYEEPNWKITWLIIQCLHRLCPLYCHVCRKGWSIDNTMLRRCKICHEFVERSWERETYYPRLSMYWKNKTRMWATDINVPGLNFFTESWGTNEIRCERRLRSENIRDSHLEWSSILSRIVCYFCSQGFRCQRKSSFDIITIFHTYFDKPK